jgi:hypothetical protein
LILSTLFVTWGFEKRSMSCGSVCCNQAMTFVRRVFEWCDLSFSSSKM